MLKFFCVFACAILCFCTFLPTDAFAAQDSVWVRITKEGVNLYADENAKKVLFVLEKSYYLEVLAEEGDMYRVTVMQNQVDFPTISGCVRKDQVKKCDEAPVAPYYPTVKVSVESDSAQIKLSPTPSAETVITVTNTQKMAFYGEIYHYDDVWYYVCFCGKFGYVSADSVSAPVISLHPTPLEQTVVGPVDPGNNGETNNKGESEQPKRNAAAEIVLIVFVVLLAVGICLALFLPGNLKKKGDVFDQDI
ncbi:MAG: hypothetical protein NC132_04610 [Corallococcus sp.]|nr:hypothetical protein [Corallococcus sp.]MCM1359668.1 hypothetical protein [Corallococcus sp.]MCM1395377.1 hypothetical protein [Corallococcus sp.]